MPKCTATTKKGAPCKRESVTDADYAAGWLCQQHYRGHNVANTAEIAARVVEIVGLLANGATRGQCVRICSKKWKVSGRQVDDYIAMAYKRCSVESEGEVAELRGLALERASRIHARAILEGKLGDALGALREQNKLLGLYAPEKHEVDNTGEIRYVHMPMPEGFNGPENADEGESDASD